MPVSPIPTVVKKPRTFQSVHHKLNSTEKCKKFLLLLLGALAGTNEQNCGGNVSHISLLHPHELEKKRPENTWTNSVWCLQGDTSMLTEIPIDQYFLHGVGQELSSSKATGPFVIRVTIIAGKKDGTVHQIHHLLRAAEISGATNTHSWMLTHLLWLIHTPCWGWAFNNYLPPGEYFHYLLSLGSITLAVILHFKTTGTHWTLSFKAPGPNWVSQVIWFESYPAEGWRFYLAHWSPSQAAKIYCGIL